jgi:uncharacterized protein
MSLQVVKLADVAAQPWRNGGGVTHELLVWPAGAAAWQLRVSVATIDADGPFSPFAGVQRCFAVVEGAGVALRFAHGTLTCVQASEPLSFDGADAPMCTLLAGSTRDLNLMVQASAGRGVMQRVSDGQTLAGRHRWRGLFCAGAATLHDGEREHALPPMCLVGAEEPQASWHCKTQAPAWSLALEEAHR